MKRLWLFCLMLLALCAPAPGGAASSPLTIAVAADLHVNPASQTKNPVNPLEPCHMEIVDAFLCDAVARDADVLLLLGDITNQGRAAQHAALLARLRAAQNVLAGQESLECRYAEAVMDVAAGKAMLLRELRERYLAGDREYLALVAEEVIPTLLGDFDRLMTLHRELWERDMKRFGWEVLSLRYGAVTGRLLDVQDELSRYLCGELATIEELDAEPMPGERYGHFQRWVTPAVGM